MELFKLKTDNNQALEKINAKLSQETISLVKSVNTLTELNEKL